jgi:periplasmic protein TonB
MTMRTVEMRTGLVRWLACGAAVTLAHAGLAAALLQRTEPVDPAEPAAAIVIALAPLPAAPLPPADDIPPGPDQVQAEAAPDKPVEPTKQEEVEERLKPEPDPEVALLPREEKPEPPKPETSPPAPVTSAPQAPQMALAAVPAAPTQGSPRAIDSTAIPTWKSRIAATLERNKRYPAEARDRRQQGVAHLAFTVDRQGHLLASHIVRGSGSDALDKETLQLLARAQPFPPPPAELAGDRIELVVPIRFHLR